MGSRRGEEPRFLERGDIYFAYRPRVDHPEPRGLEEVQRLFVILQPELGDRQRRLVVGRKRLPEEEEHERFWGFVDEVGTRPEEVEEELERTSYETRTRGPRVSHGHARRGKGSTRSSSTATTRISCTSSSCPGSRARSRRSSTSTARAATSSR